MPPTNICLACIKHLVGSSQPINGTNGSPTRKFLQFISLSVMSRSIPSSRIFTTSLKSTCATGFQIWCPIRHLITVSIGWPVLFRNFPRNIEVLLLLQIPTRPLFRYYHFLWEPPLSIIFLILESVCK